MSRKRYLEEFKVEAVRQFTEADYSAYDVAERLGTTTNSLHSWIRRYEPNASDFKIASQESDEIRRLKKELKRVTDERDLLKKSRGVLREPPLVRYAFIKDHACEFTIRSLCRLFNLHPSGYYALLRAPKSTRQCRDNTLSGFIKQAWLESGCICGYRKIHRDIQDFGERYGINRVHKLMRDDGI